MIQRRPSELNARKKYAAVSDFDGVLGKGDAAGLFWKSRGQEADFFALSHLILDAKKAHPGDRKKIVEYVRAHAKKNNDAVAEAVNRNWPLPHGCTVKAIFDVQ